MDMEIVISSPIGSLQPLLNPLLSCIMQTVLQSNLLFLVHAEDRSTKVLRHIGNITIQHIVIAQKTVIFKQTKIPNLLKYYTLKPP
jgi:hypothetical protein